MAANTPRRNALLACAALVVGALALTACGGNATTDGSSSRSKAQLSLAADSLTTKTAQGGTASAKAAGLDYVALGSSFAAGPSIPPLQSSSGAAACSRSADNYAGIVARDTGAKLTDVTCSGATTANILTTKQGSQPPQINAVNSGTDLVTITIGGNDVNYLGSAVTYSCQNSGGANCGTVSQAAINTALGSVGQKIENVVNAVKARAPQARILLVSYSTLLPDTGGCTGVPLTADQRTFERTVAARLAQAYIDTANRTGATLVRFATASHGHDACAATPWVEKYKPASGRTTYHPNEAGMKAAASLVKSALG
ncbi:SGNH/GDSL hydrolase family protein [Streptomyces sp. NPDC002680]|uniref:SGNH/GDSL hydrolase family protein n=1 Tax=Streptomyces sp. NPDC002680 TaxID=3364659 RepID=UPI00368DAC5D